MNQRVPDAVIENKKPLTDSSCHPGKKKQAWVKEKYAGCFLCGRNCGLEFKLDEEDKVVKILGAKENPISKGFICNKGAWKH